MDRISAWGPLIRLVVLAAMYYAASLQLVTTVFEHSGEVAAFRFGQNLEGQGEPPFNYRVLMPTVTSAIAEVIPDRVAERVLRRPIDGLGRTRMQVLRTRFSWVRPIGKDMELFLAYVFSVFGCFVAAWFLRALASGHGAVAGERRPQWFADVFPLTTLLLLPPLFMEGAYFYDFTELMFASIALWAALERRWMVFRLVLAIAILNKEVTAAWCAWPILLWPDRRAVIREGLISALIAVPLFFANRAMHQVAGRPAQEFNLVYNLDWLITPSTYIKFAATYGIGLPFPRGLNLFNVAVIAALGVLGWRQTKIEVRRVLVVTVLPLLGAWLVFGNKDEFRIFMAAVPAAALMLHVGLWNTRKPDCEPSA